MLLVIKEDIFDIIFYFWWWILILDIVIVFVQKILFLEIIDVEIVFLKCVDKNFEIMLEDLIFGNGEFQKVVLKDREFLLNKVVEFLRFYNGEFGISLRENCDYLFFN